MEKKINKLFMKNKYNYFGSKKLERIEFFKKYGLDICELYKNIEKLFDNNYDKFEDINYAFGKLESILNVCQFLRKTQKEKNHDTDKKIIFELVSLSESIYSLIKQIHNTENLIKGFFRPVKEKLKINIRPGIIHATHPIFENSGGCIGARILYLMRNDYVHNINFTGKVFLSSKTKKEIPETYNCFSFYINKRESIFIECNLTYDDFLSIFLEAFIKNIEKLFGSGK